MKKKIVGIFVCMLLVLTSISAIGQIINKTIFKNDNNFYPTNNGDKWMKTFGGIWDDMGNSAIQTNDGGYIIIGITSSSMELKWDTYLIKTDNMGKKIWDKTFGGENADIGKKVKQTSDEGYIIIGHTESLRGYADFWLIKTDSEGNKLWDKTFDADGNEWGLDVIELSSGGYLIVGLKGPKEPPMEWMFHSDIWLIKTDDMGNKIWDKTFGGYGQDIGKSIVQIDEDSFIIVGHCWTIENSDLWLLKIDNEGELIWDKQIDKENDFGESVQLTTDGGFIITGQTSLDSSGPTNYDVWLLKTDGEGNMLWNKTFGSNHYDIGYSVRQANNGGYVIAGSTQKPISSDGFLIKTDSNGEKEWIKYYDNSIFDLLRSVELTTDGGYILTGYESSRVFSDIWLIKTDSSGNVLRNKVSFFYYHGLRFLDMFPVLKRILRFII